MKIFKLNENNSVEKTLYQRLMECEGLKIEEIKEIFYSITDYPQIQSNKNCFLCKVVHC